MNKLPPLKESVIQRQILAYLKAKGIFAWRQNVGMVPVGGAGDGKGWRRSTVTGVPDILGILQGVYPTGEGRDGFKTAWHVGTLLAIEVKRKGGKPPTPEQESFLAEIKKRGGVAFVAYSLADVQRVLG